MINLIRIKPLYKLLQYSRIRNLVHITQNEDILIRSIGKRLCQRILLKFIPFVCRDLLRRIVHNQVCDLRQKFFKHFPVFFKTQILRKSRKGVGCLLNHKPVHQRIQNMQTKL